MHPPFCKRKSPYLCSRKQLKKNIMKKFITDNIAWIVILILLVAATALVIARRNRRALIRHKCSGATFTQEEKDKIMQVCNVQNANTSPNND